MKNDCNQNKRLKVKLTVLYLIIFWTVIFAQNNKGNALVGFYRPVKFDHRTGSSPANSKNNVLRYAEIPGAEKSRLFSVSVDGKEIFVEKFKDISYARFAFSGKANLKITARDNFGKYSISPLSYNIASQKTGNTISFSLDNPMKLILQFKGIEEKLFIFADAPEVGAPKIGDNGVTSLMDFVTDNSGRTLQTNKIQKAIDEISGKGGGVLFVPNGKYLTGTFVMKSNVTLYLESGVIIQGSGNLKDYNDMGANKSGVVTEGKGALIYFNKADNAHIAGQGVIAMAGTKIKTETGQKIRICNFIECNNSGISNVIIRDSGGFNIHILNSSNITMKGYKIINDLSLPNEDGTDPDGCNGVVVDNVFMYTSDDAIAVKADSRLCQNILVKNCVFWTKKSALKVGSDPYYRARNIVFQNNDVVHADRALALYSGCGGIENVKFIDNKSEFVGGDAKRQLIVFQVSNAKENNPEQNRRGIGYIKNVEVINYTAFQKSENKSIISGTVSSNGTVHKVSNVWFKNMVIEGKHCLNADDADIILSPKKLPADPNVRSSVLAEKPDRVMTVENIRFQ